jgi:uncharacterized small protein (DUF1192 family)
MERPNSKYMFPDELHSSDDESDYYSEDDSDPELDARIAALEAEVARKLLLTSVSLTAVEEAKKKQAKDLDYFNQVVSAIQESSTSQEICAASQILERGAVITFTPTGINMQPQLRLR